MTSSPSRAMEPSRVTISGSFMGASPARMRRRLSSTKWRDIVRSSRSSRWVPSASVIDARIDTAVCSVSSTRWTASICIPQPRPRGAGAAPSCRSPVTSDASITCTGRPVNFSMIAISTCSFGSLVVDPSSSQPTHPSIASAAWALRSKRSDRWGIAGRDSQVRISAELSSERVKRWVAAIDMLEDAILIVETVRTSRPPRQGLGRSGRGAGRRSGHPVLAR